MTGEAEGSTARLDAAQQAFERGDYARARRLAAPVCVEEGEAGAAARELVNRMSPERRIVWTVGVVCALLFAVLFSYYVIGKPTG